MVCLGHYFFMLRIIEFPTGGYGISEGNPKKGTWYLYSFTQNKMLQINPDYKGLIPIEYKHNDFKYVLNCISEINRNMKDPLSEHTLPY